MEDEEETIFRLLQPAADREAPQPDERSSRCEEVLVVLREGCREVQRGFEGWIAQLVEHQREQLSQQERLVETVLQAKLPLEQRGQPRPPEPVAPLSPAPQAQAPLQVQLQPQQAGSGSTLQMPRPCSATTRTGERRASSSRLECPTVEEAKEQRRRSREKLESSSTIRSAGTLQGMSKKPLSVAPAVSFTGRGTAPRLPDAALSHPGVVPTAEWSAGVEKSPSEVFKCWSGSHEEDEEEEAAAQEDPVGFVSSTTTSNFRRPAQQQKRVSQQASEKSESSFNTGFTSKDEGLSNEMESVVDVEVSKDRSLIFHRASRTFNSLVSGITDMTDGQATAKGQWCLQRLVDSSVFNGLCLAVILANAVFMGAMVELSVQHEIERTQNPNATADFARPFSVLEWLFCLFFTLELLLRVLSGPSLFARGPDWNWNLFDSILVLTCLADLILKEIKDLNLSYVRILRIVRMARILRIIRVMRFFRSLRLMVYSIMHSMLSLLWVFILLLFAMYTFSISILYTLLDFFKDKADSQSRISDDSSSMTLVQSFSTISTALTSLFMAICGGRDWHELYAPLLEVSTFCGLIFIFYVFFVVFGVLNTVTGAFVDSMRLESMKDNDVVIEEELKRATTFKNNVTNIFREADTDASGTLSWEEFEAHLKDPRVKAYFQTLGIDISQARALFVLIDVEENNEVPIDKFIEGCMRMRGNARSLDVNMLLYENEKMLCKITAFVEYVESKFDRVELALGLSRPGSIMADHRVFRSRRSSAEWLQDRMAQAQDRRRSNRSGIPSEAGSSRRVSLSSRNWTTDMPHAPNRVDHAINILACCESSFAPRPVSQASSWVSARERDLLSSRDLAGFKLTE